LGDIKIMKSRITAALLAFFLGGLGFHKFYLGQTVAGVFYLLFSWTLIPGIIAFFETIGLLVMSDRAFDAQFNYKFMGYSGSAGELSKDKAATLGELKKLYDQGIITAEEYEGKRRKILDSI
jgi:TM2 domain-containing membrane protein YozV